MDGQVISVIFTALIVSVFAPLILAWSTARHQRQSKQQDWDRQDVLSKRAEDAVRATAAELKASNAVIAAKVDGVAATADVVAVRVDEVAVAAEVAQAETHSQLDQIHTLVNSELFEAQRRELAATEAQLVAMREVVDLRQAGGVEPTAADEDALLELEMRINGMARGLAAKARQTDAAEVERTRRPGP